MRRRLGAIGGGAVRDGAVGWVRPTRRLRVGGTPGRQAICALSARRGLRGAGGGGAAVRHSLWVPLERRAATAPALRAAAGQEPTMLAAVKFRIDNHLVAVGPGRGEAAPLAARNATMLRAPYMTVRRASMPPLPLPPSGLHGRWTSQTGLSTARCSRWRVPPRCTQARACCTCATIRTTRAVAFWPSSKCGWKTARTTPSPPVGPSG